MNKVYAIEHTFGEAWESSYTEIKKAFFDKVKADEHVKLKNEEFEALTVSHGEIYEQHVKDCEDDDCTCQICSKWWDEERYIFDSHSWKVIELEVE